MKRMNANRRNRLILPPQVFHLRADNIRSRGFGQSCHLHFFDGIILKFQTHFIMTALLKKTILRTQIVKIGYRAYLVCTVFFQWERPCYFQVFKYEILLNNNGMLQYRPRYFRNRKYRMRKWWRQIFAIWNAKHGKNPLLCLYSNKNSNEKDTRSAGTMCLLLGKKVL